MTNAVAFLVFLLLVAVAVFSLIAPWLVAVYQLAGRL